MEREGADVICISEVGPYRQMKGYPNYVKSDTHRQSAIFWKRHLRVEKIHTDLNKKHTRILTQCIIIAAPELKNSARGAYWRDLLMAIEEWKPRKPEYKIIIPGDLTTLDERFTILHQEQDRYLDEVLLNFAIISDCRIPTRGDNTLEVALANREAKRGNIRSQVMRKLNNDHNPTKTKIDLECNPY